MAYTGQQRFLLQAAEKYTALGYKVGLTKAKVMLGEYQPTEIGYWGPVQRTQPEGFDGVSIIPDGVVCVDFDIPDFGIVWEPLPPTWKERSPHGFHLFYLLPHGSGVYNLGSPKIKWREGVDLLVKTKPMQNKKVSYGGGLVDVPSAWGEHIICSPTQGYTRIWPDQTPLRDKLTLAPDWLVDALLKQ